MTAGMADPHKPSFGRGGRGLTGVLEAGLLLHRQAVHVRSDQDGGSWPVAQEGHDSGAANASVRLEAQVPEFACHQCAGEMFLENQFRVMVEVTVDRLHVGGDQHFLV